MSAERLKYNKKILKFIENFLKEHEDLRFCQALYALSLNPNEYFYEEPNITLQRLEKAKEE